MKKLFLGLLLLLPFSARAADTTLAVTAGSGTTIVVTPSGSDIVPHSIPCDHTTPSQCAAFDSTGHLAVLAPPNATALAASNASAPLAAGLMVSDSSLMQRVFAPVIIGDAVNGNNMLATGVWGFNGTTWDRVQVDASKNLKVAPTTGLAQASTTSGQIGPLVQCAVTTDAPSYTTAQTDPLSCDTTGALRVNGGSASIPAGSAIIGSVLPPITTLVTGTASTTANTTTQLIAAVTSKVIYVTAYACDDKDGTNSGHIDFQDGSGGTTVWTTTVQHSNGGANLAGGGVLFKTTSGVGLYFQSDTAITTLYCSAAGFAQ